MFATVNKKTDVIEHPRAFDHVGLLRNEPTGTAGLLFIQSSNDSVSAYPVELPATSGFFLNRPQRAQRERWLIGAIQSTYSRIRFIGALDNHHFRAAMRNQIARVGWIDRRHESPWPNLRRCSRPDNWSLTGQFFTVLSGTGASVDVHIEFAASK